MTPKFAVSDRLKKLAGPPVNLDGTLSSAELMLTGYEDTSPSLSLSEDAAIAIVQYCIVNLYNPLRRAS